MNVTELVTQYHADPSMIPPANSPLPTELGQKGNPVELLELEANAILGHMIAVLMEEVDATLASTGAVYPLLRVRWVDRGRNTYEPVSFDEIAGLSLNELVKAEMDMLGSFVDSSAEWVKWEHARAVARLDRLVDALLEIHESDPEDRLGLSRWRRFGKDNRGLNYMRHLVRGDLEAGVRQTIDVQRAAIERWLIDDPSKTWGELRDVLAGSESLTMRHARLPNNVSHEFNARIVFDHPDAAVTDEFDMSAMEIKDDGTVDWVRIGRLHRVVDELDDDGEPTGRQVLDPRATVEGALRKHRASGRTGKCPASIRVSRSTESFVGKLWQLSAELQMIRLRRLLPGRRWDSPPVDFPELQKTFCVEVDGVQDIRVIIRDSEGMTSSIDAVDEVADAMDFEILDGTLHVTQIRPIDSERLADGVPEIVIKLKHLGRVTSRRVADLTVEGNCDMHIDVPPSGVFRGFSRYQDDVVPPPSPDRFATMKMSGSAEVDIVARPGATAVLAIALGSIRRLRVHSQDLEWLSADVGILAKSYSWGLEKSLTTKAIDGTNSDDVRIDGLVAIAFTDEVTRWHGLDSLPAQVKELLRGQGTDVRLTGFPIHTAEMRELVGTSAFVPAAVGHGDDLVIARASTELAV